MELLEAVIDEVALEGLDGITVPALWLRLHARVPPFPLLLDAATKQFVWQSLVCYHELDFYQLPEERRPLVTSNRYEGLDSDPGVLTAKGGSCSEDIYPVHIITDNKHGIQGSCQYFKERILVSELIRKQTITCEEAIARWGEKLAIVGSQTLRSRSLIGWEGDPSLEISDCSYCILEKLGRSRWQGEIQKDLQGIFNVDAGKIHYLRRVLDRNGLITMQTHVIKLPNGTQQHSLLLLLKRFHVDRRNKYDMLTEKVSSMLSECDNQMETLVNLREELGLPERLFKRLYYYMANAGIVKIISLPLHEIQPLAEHCRTKKGTDIMVRCMKLIKEYKRKEDEEDDDDDEDDMKAISLPVDVIYEKDMLTQTYELIENRGTKGISQREIQMAMNVGKLEARMLCRLLERYMLIKGFMEDEGRQRTTKFISHVFVEESDIRRQFLEEKAKSEKLSMFNSAPAQNIDDKTMSPENNSPEEKQILEDDREQIKSSKKLKIAETCSFLDHHTASTSTPLLTSKGRFRIQKKQALSIDADKTSVVSENDCSMDSFHLESNLSSFSARSADDEDDDDVSVIEEILDKDTEAKRGKKCWKTGTLERSRETYRLLKRRNIIVETVKNLRLVESLFTLQKMIVDQEKQEGVSTRCCKKSILRLVQKLSQEGLVRLYRTVVVQDGISKKVEFVVHPSINPNDPLVKSAIEQIRFRISNSTSGNRTRSPQGPSTPGKADADDQNKDKQREKHSKASLFHSDSQDHLLKQSDAVDVTQLKNYHPIIVPGLGRSLGYLPKMPRLKITHIFLWYIVYGHPSHKAQPQQISDNKPLSDTTAEKQCENVTPPLCHPAGGISSTDVKKHPSSKTGNVEEYLSDHGTEQNTEMVYVDEVSWVRYIPPATVHCEYGSGWVLVSDILLCLPLSIFIQIVQVSYKVENIEDYLNDPIKKHTLIRYLPRSMRQQLLYKRRYVFSVFQGLQKLSCMGLVQFGPSEKFQDKDQVFVYVKKKATIVDTTACDPHYNIAQGSHPFEKRSYSLETFQDVENFWFDLQFVCLNTPLGVVRYPRGKKTNTQSQEESLLGQGVDTEQEDRPHLERKCNILESVPGSREVVDDGLVPGDGLGAGGLDSSFYSHLKRNWIWISYIINKTKKTKSAQEGLTLRLQTFLNKHTLPLGSIGNQKSVFGDVAMSESGDLVQMVKEATAHRNKRVCGGKNQKRKRQKKETEKKQKPKKKKKETKEEKNRRNRYHDEADQNALQRMTRLRVAWTAQEDGLLMLCRIASNILNRKVKRPFVPWQVVRDIMHSNLEESLDKTSHSIGRRARYIMKNPQTYLNYKPINLHKTPPVPMVKSQINPRGPEILLSYSHQLVMPVGVCLAEVYQDKGLVEEFMNRKACYDDPKVCAEEFKEFVVSLKLKFSTHLGDPVYKIPDTVEELFNRFRVLAVGDESNQERGLEIINSVDDIQILVLQNLILSTLALSDMQMKSCRSLQTFRMYRQYRDDILVKAFVEFQKKRLVNRRRGNHTLGPKKNRALPFVPMSFQLSQTYYRLFTWRFPSTICTESFQFLETLKAYGNADQPDVFSFGDQPNEATTDMLVFPLDGPGGQCVTILSLLLLGFMSVNVKIPDQIVVVDSTLVENEVMKSLGRDGLDDEDFDDEEVDDNLGHKRKIEVKARQASHTNYLLMRGYCAPGIVSTRNLNPNDNVVVNSCQVRVKLRNTPLNGRLKDSGSFSDFIESMPSLPPHFTELLNIKDRVVNTFLSHCIKCHRYSSEDVSCVLEIQSAVEACSYFGMKMSDLGERFFKYEHIEEGRTRSLQQYIQDLLTYRQVLQVGGASVRLVATTHADPWVLHSYCLKEQPSQDKAFLMKGTDCSETDQQAIEGQTESDTSIYEPPRKKALLELGDTDMERTVVPVMPRITESDLFTQKMDTGETAGILHERESDCCFLGRPWRIVDGSLNKPVCKGMLEAILYQIMTKPGITENNLLHHYNDVLQPVVILELLQVLEQIGCIKKHYIEKPTKVTLFSQSVIPELFKIPKLSESLTVFYEPTIDCTLRLGGIFPSEVNWNKWVL